MPNMQIATIVSQNRLHMIKDDKYHLALAHLLLDPKMNAYRTFYKEMCKREDVYVILDNGAIEVGTVPLEDLLTIGFRTGVDEIILPDVFQDGFATAKMIKQADEAITKMIIENKDHLFTNFLRKVKFMAVPQGKSLNEWLVWTEIILKECRHVSVIGIPKHLATLCPSGSRKEALIYLASELGNFTKKDNELLLNREFHLLGCWNTPVEIIEINSMFRDYGYFKVRGVDSGISQQMALAGISLDNANKPHNRPYGNDMFCDDLTVFDEDTPQSVIESYVQLLEQNVHKWKTMFEKSKVIAIG